MNDAPLKRPGIFMFQDFVPVNTKAKEQKIYICLAIFITIFVSNVYFLLLIAVL